VTGAWIWRRLTHNFFWKLASLAVAILLWFAVVGEPELVAIQPVPLLYRNLPGDLLLLSDAPDQVHAELRGSSGRLTRATLSDVVAAVDLGAVTSPGTQTFTLAESDFSLPQGVTFLRAVPSQVTLRFDRMSNRDVPVQIQLTGMLPPGYHLAAKTVEPETLNVSGPESRVSGIQFAQTDPVDLSGVTGNTEVKVNAFLTDPRAQFTSAPLVTVRLTVEKENGTP
jgi:YbbR-like protein